MKYTVSNILIVLLLVILIVGASLMQAKLKAEQQINLLLFGFLVLGSLFVKKISKIPILFYVLLGIILYINISSITNQIVNIINPNDGWIIDNQGKSHRVMQMNWIWGFLIGIVLSPLVIVLYHKKIQRNKVLEISFTTIFIISTAIIYIKNEIL